MKSNAFRRGWVFASCVCVTVLSAPLFAQDDALRKFFKENNRLVLVNPYPQSLPIGIIMQHEGGELREIDRDCFLPYQSEAVPPESYDFIAKNTEKKREITANFLKHLGKVDVGSSEKVSIRVVETTRVVMPESRLVKIIQDSRFPTGCSQLLSDKRNHIVYEIVTGRLYFTFWKKVNGNWERSGIPFVSALLEKQGKGTTKQNEAVSTQGNEEDHLTALWIATKEGGIEMKEPRVLAVHARHWRPGSPGKLGDPMPFSQFKRLWNLDWKLVSSQK